jgi:hypothetical protein
MADITLDPDDDSTAWVWAADTKNNSLDRAHDASAVFKNNHLKAVEASANVLQVRDPSSPILMSLCVYIYFSLGFRSPRRIWWLTVSSVLYGRPAIFLFEIHKIKSRSPSVTTVSQRNLLAPSLPSAQPPAAIASTSTSVSPSPFAPLASKSSSSLPPSHPAAKEAPDMDCRAHGHAGSKYVMIHATTASRGDKAELGDLSRDEPSQGGAAAGAQETPIVDPPSDPCLPSQKQVVSVPSLLLCACMHTSCDRI